MREPNPERRVKISIHALREEGDAVQAASRQRGSNFYPRPPRGGRRWRMWSERWGTYFYPRPPRGGRRQTNPRNPDTVINFYPRPPRGGRQGAIWCKSENKKYFYPRPPRGGRP